MKSLEEIRAEFVDDDGNVDVTHLDAINEKVAAELAKTPVSYQPTGAEYLELTEAHFGHMVQFLLAQMADVYGYATEIHRIVEKALIGGTELPSPSEAAAQFVAETRPFVVYDRLARLYALVYGKSQKKLVTP